MLSLSSLKLVDKLFSPRLMRDANHRNVGADPSRAPSRTSGRRSGQALSVRPDPGPAIPRLRGTYAGDQGVNIGGQGASRQVGTTPLQVVNSLPHASLGKGKGIL